MKDESLLYDEVNKILEEYNWKERMNEATAAELVERLADGFSWIELVNFWLLLLNNRTNDCLRFQLLTHNIRVRKSVWGEVDPNELEKAAESRRKLFFGEAFSKKISILNRASDKRYQIDILQR